MTGQGQSPAIMVQTCGKGSTKATCGEWPITGLAYTPQVP
jgi:hypothetical protein